MRRRWHYVRDLDFGNFYLLENTEKAKSGFFIHDDDQSVDGGFGFGRTWEYVQASEVPRKRRKQLSWLKNVAE